MVIIIIGVCLLIIIICAVIIFVVILRRKSETDNNLGVREGVKSVSYSPRSGMDKEVMRNIPPIIHDYGNRETNDGDMGRHNEMVDNDNDIMTPRLDIALKMVQMAIDNDNDHNVNDDAKDDIYIDNPGTNNHVMDDNIATSR